MTSKYEKEYYKKMLEETIVKELEGRLGRFSSEMYNILILYTTLLFIALVQNNKLFKQGTVSGYFLLLSSAFAISSLILLSIGGYVVKIKKDTFFKIKNEKNRINLDYLVENPKETKNITFNSYQKFGILLNKFSLVFFGFSILKLFTSLIILIHPDLIILSLIIGTVAIISYFVKKKII